jgi:hypothetical protein
MDELFKGQEHKFLSQDKGILQSDNRGREKHTDKQTVRVLESKRTIQF